SSHTRWTNPDPALKTGFREGCEAVERTVEMIVPIIGNVTGAEPVGPAARRSGHRRERHITDRRLGEGEPKIEIRIAEPVPCPRPQQRSIAARPHEVEGYA